MPQFAARFGQTRWHRASLNDITVGDNDYTGTRARGQARQAPRMTHGKDRFASAVPGSCSRTGAPSEGAGRAVRQQGSASGGARADVQEETM